MSDEFDVAPSTPAAHLNVLDRLLPPGGRAEWTAHWRVVLGTFFGMALAYPSFSFAQSQFMEPLQEAFGWSRAQISFAFHINIFIPFAAPLYGRLIDRFGVRPVLSLCIILMSAGYIVLAMGTGSYPLFVVSCLFMVAFGMGTTGIAYTRGIVSWFSKSRGTALALSRIGLSLFGAVIPIIVFHTIQATSWRGGFVFLAAIAVLVALPVSYAWVRDRRESEEPNPEGKTSTPAPLLDWRIWIQLLGNWRILLICAAAALTYAPVIGVLAHLQPLLTSKGIAPATAAGMAAFLALSVVAGTLISGVLVDRIWAPIVACVFTLLPVAGCLVLMQPEPSFLIAATAIVLVGLAQGAEIDVVAYMIARYFGVRAYATIYGLSVLIMMMTTASASVFFGWIYDRYETYDPALAVGAAAFAIAAVSYLAMGKYPENPDLEIAPRSDES